MSSKNIIKEINQQVCKEYNPSGWDMYAWAEEHNETAIAHAIKRIEKIFDFSDQIYSGFSSGKDSTLSINLAMMEIARRKLRVKHGVDRDGKKTVDPLDKKWSYDYKRIIAMQTDAEIVYTKSNEYTFRFFSTHIPLGNLVYFHVSLPLSWQNGTDFNTGVLVSWDENKKNIWCQPMPDRKDIGNVDVVNEHNLENGRAVPIQYLPEIGQKLAREDKIVIKVPYKDINLVEVQDSWVDKDENVEAVANFGRGPMNFWRWGMHEKDFTHDFGKWLIDTNKYVTGELRSESEEIQQALQKRYDTSRDVWHFADINGIVSTGLVSLRAAESLDRRVILSQGEYSTGQYSIAQGQNICSPVFDFVTSDVWRLMSAADWDFNEMYELMQQALIGIDDQRIGSLLNYAATRNVRVVKQLEPVIYNKIMGRFQNIEFMSAHAKQYYNTGKPRDTHWNGYNHIKAGKTEEEIKNLSDKYEQVLKQIGVEYVRKGNRFHPVDKKITLWTPIKDYLESIGEKPHEIEIIES